MTNYGKRANEAGKPAGLDDRMKQSTLASIFSSTTAFIYRLSNVHQFCMCICSPDEAVTTPTDSLGPI